ncbi:MAG: NADH-quinone oxidoreductase subunit C, partial [Gemmatimonadaceae bacterium]|nr:NADH-quinone oxidoreductase subunit C [Gemmatimonadaceae bacterium]
MSGFTVIEAGSAPGLPTPVTPRNVPHRGGEANPSAEALKAQFGAAITRVDVVWGETNVTIDPARALDIVRWLHDDPSQSYEYLSDVTAVEFRDRGMPIEMIWHLRSIKYRRFLRLKAPLAKGQPLTISSVWSVYKSADWLERECYDMFGIAFEGHPNLRRILLPDEWDEGFPLRKDYPLRGWKEFPVYNTERTVARTRTRWTGRGV